MFSEEMDLTEILQAGAQALMANGMSASVLLSVALLLAVSLGRRLLSSRFPILKTDVGAVGFTLALATAAGVANAAVAGSALSWALFAGSLKVALAAMGGFSAIKKFLIPLLALAKSKAPKFGFIFDFASQILGAAGYKAIETSVSKGKQAVTKSPGKGIEGALGKPKSPPTKGAKSRGRR
jgi:hypothetical protein